MLYKWTLALLMYLYIFDSSTMIIIIIQSFESFRNSFLEIKYHTDPSILFSIFFSLNTKDVTKSNKNTGVKISKQRNFLGYPSKYAAPRA